MLKDTGLISIRGKDAQSYLQGLVTVDIKDIQPGQYRLSGCCNPKGRVVASFFLFRYNETYYFSLPRRTIPILLAHLRKYAMFSKVDIQEVTDHFVVDPAFLWPRHPIFSGLPTIYPETSGLFTPHMLNYDQFGGISLSKGCYLGQEIIARTANLGSVKKHLSVFTLESHSLPVSGSILNNEQSVEVGVVLDACHRDDLVWLSAVVQDHALSEPIYSHGKLLTNIKNIPDTLKKPCEISVALKDQK